MVRSNRRALRPDIDRLEDRSLLSSVGPPGGYSPAQVKAAYGLDAIRFSATGGQTLDGDGNGQSIAIVVAYHDPNLSSDLQMFDRGFGLPDPILSQVNLGSLSNTNDGWAGEETLDVEWAHAIAPRAKLDVVEAASDAPNDLLAAVNVARLRPGVVAVSMSWSRAELAEERSYDAVFTTPAGHPGITFVAATGDTGAGGGAEWPASSPNVLAVGGTSLSIDAASGYGGESSWSGSGRGLSRYEAEPSYQRALQSTGRRSVPDVAFLADPNTGVVVYSTNPSDHSGGWQVVGGTSLGTPAWAAIVAIVDEGLALNGQGSLDGVTQLIPRLYALPASDFHTIGNVSNRRVAFGLSNTAATTGLGTPVGQAILNDLVYVSSSLRLGTAISSMTPLGHAQSPIKGKQSPKPTPPPHPHTRPTAKLARLTASRVEPAWMNIANGFETRDHALFRPCE